MGGGRACVRILGRAAAGVAGRSVAVVVIGRGGVAGVVVVVVGSAAEVVGVGRRGERVGGDRGRKRGRS